MDFVSVKARRCLLRILFNCDFLSELMFTGQHGCRRQEVLLRLHITEHDIHLRFDKMNWQVYDWSYQRHWFKDHFVVELIHILIMHLYFITVWKSCPQGQRLREINTFYPWKVTDNDHVYTKYTNVFINISQWCNIVYNLIW